VTCISEEETRKAKYSSPQVGDQRGARDFLIDFDQLARLDVSPSEGRDPTEV
jgi:hypothetical protein